MTLDALNTCLQTEGFDGVLEPLKPLREKLLIMRDVDQVRADANGINAHFDGATAASNRALPALLGVWLPGRVGVVKVARPN